MNRNELCSCKFCVSKCQKYVKNYKKRRICFKDQNKNKPLTQNKQYLKQQIRNKKITERILNHNKAKRFINYNALASYRTLYNTNDENLNETSFADDLRDFFVEPKEETRKIWRRKDRSVKLAPNLKQQNSLKRKAEELEHTRVNIFDELFPDATNDISSSVEVRPKLVTSVPNVTVQRFHLRKMNNHKQVNELLYKELPIYKKKIASHNFNRTSGKKEFIARWFEGPGQKYESLQTFSKVFRNLDELATTKKFCSWLRNHPEIEPPSYLLEHGILEQNESIRTSSPNSSQKLLPSHYKFDINNDYISNHFKKFKFSHDSSSSTSSSSISNPFISDIEIII